MRGVAELSFVSRVDNMNITKLASNTLAGQVLEVVGMGEGAKTTTKIDFEGGMRLARPPHPWIRICIIYFIYLHAQLHRELA